MTATMDETRTLTYEEAKEALLEAVNIDPNRVMTRASGCYYVSPVDMTTPTCLIGVAMDLLGVDVATWVLKDKHRNVRSWSRVQDCGDVPPIQMDGKAARLWTLAQLSQDQGLSWRESFHLAVLKVEDED